MTIVLWKQGILRDAFYWTIADHDIPHVFWRRECCTRWRSSESVCLWCSGRFWGAGIRVRFGLRIARTNSAFRAAFCVGHRRRSRRSVLLSLLCPNDSSSCLTSGAVLRPTLVPHDGAVPLVTAAQGHIRVVRSNRYWLFNYATGRGLLCDAFGLGLDDTCSGIRPLPTGFWSGADARIFIWTPTDVLLAAISQRFR